MHDAGNSRKTRKKERRREMHNIGAYKYVRRTGAFIENSFD